MGEQSYVEVRRRLGLPEIPAGVLAEVRAEFEEERALHADPAWVAEQRAHYTPLLAAYGAVAE
ncbi:hypothetical protein [Catellatospora tritici]|uniref:hypothetical protein n=1 Tax=Catellatospora tritici TaxID=2851566 RepID=UPI001C2CCCB3|nr:hypothetical protein [Catellatospora tritici]MBV1855709.1 hypothetical protein [Catellatospora tritici]